jgi:hypothetical protein
MADTANLGTYSPEDVIMIIGNDQFSHTVSGMVDGTFINYERTVDRATLYVGADLHAGRVLRRNKAGTVTVTLSKFAESNDVFTRIAELDEEAHNNDWLFSVTIKDTTGRSLFYAPQAFIGNDPNIAYGTDQSDREWTIVVMNVQKHTGGSSKFTPENQATLESLGYVVDDRWKTNAAPPTP